MACRPVEADCQRQPVRARGHVPVLAAAVLRLKTVMRLPYPVRVFLRPDAGNVTACLAFLDADTLNIAVAAGLIGGDSPAALAYHLATAAFHGLQHHPQYLGLLLTLRAPFDLEDRLKAYEILRLNRYAANCFALVCCDGLEIATRHGFSMVTGIPVAGSEPALNLDILADHAIKNTALNGGNVLDDYSPLDHYEPILPLVLRRFMESEPYRACRGESGGTPREHFEAEILELDRQAYPPTDTIPKIHGEFAAIASLLAAHWVMEACGPVTQRREEILLESFELERKRLDEIATQTGWRREGETNTKQLLDALSGGRDWKNIHCVHIIRTAFLIAAEEHNGRLPDKVKAAFVEIGRTCRLEPNECSVVCEVLMEEATNETGTSE